MRGILFRAEFKQQQGLVKELADVLAKSKIDLNGEPRVSVACSAAGRLLEITLRQQQLLESATKRCAESPSASNSSTQCSMIICGSPSKSNGTFSWLFARATPAT